MTPFILDMYFHTIDPKILTLQSDMIVYKTTNRGMGESKNYKRPRKEFCSMYTQFTYNECVFYNQEINLRPASEYEQDLMRGFYLRKHILQMQVTDAGFHAWLRKPESVSEFLRNPYRYGCGDYKVGKFVIPKGSKVLINESLEEVVSNRIMFLEEVGTLTPNHKSL